MNAIVRYNEKKQPGATLIRCAIASNVFKIDSRLFFLRYSVISLELLTSKTNQSLCDLNIEALY